MVDAAQAKVALLQASSESEYIYSIPQVVFRQDQDEQKPFIELDNFFFPRLEKPVVNSVNLAKNSFVLTPFAGGKTALLTSILSCLYMANIGIVPAKHAQFTYFSRIRTHIDIFYEIGSSISRHMAERRAFGVTRELANILTDLGEGYMFFVADEIFSSTIPQLAVRILQELFPQLMDNSNVMVIVSTHFPELARNFVGPDAKNPRDDTVLYYLEVVEVDGKFKKLYVLRKDVKGTSDDNWWGRDTAKAFRYGAWQSQQDNKESERINEEERLGDIPRDIQCDLTDL